MFIISTVGTLKRFAVRYHDKFLGDRSNFRKNMPIFPFFQYGGFPPCWICDARVWTTYEGHLVVFLAVQNAVGIDAVVLITCMFLISQVWLENTYSRPKLGLRTATKPVNRLQIRPIVQNQGAVPTTHPSYIRVRA